MWVSYSNGMDMEIDVSHQVDLDYSEIQENLDFSNYVEYDDLTEAIEDKLPDLDDYVEYSDLSGAIDENLPDMEEECTQQAGALLRSFVSAESPCGLGHEFIQAVQKAMTWQGDRFVEPAFTNSEARTEIEDYTTWLDNLETQAHLKDAVRAVLADILLGTPNVNGETTHEIGND